MFGDGGFIGKIGFVKLLAIGMGIVLLVILPIAVVLTLCGLQEYIRAALVWTVVLASVVYVSKQQRRKLWFWVTLTACTPAHIWLSNRYQTEAELVALFELMVLIAVLAALERWMMPPKKPDGAPGVVEPE